MKINSSLRTLIIANLAALPGVLFLGWDVGEIMLAYWLENIVIGVLNLVKMMIVVRRNPAPAGQDPRPLFIMPFYVVHYGMFTLVHGVFIVMLFGVTLEDWPALFLLLPLFAHHLYSLVTNYIRQKEYARTYLMKQMFAPYARVVVLHLAILFGGFVVMITGSSIGALLIFIAGKIILDSALHLFSHSAQLDESAV